LIAHWYWSSGQLQTAILLIKHDTFVCMKNGYSWLRAIRLVCLGISATLICGGIAGCTSQKTYDNPVVVIETKFGDITLELYPQKAPATVSAFLKNIDSGYFNNCSFYRVLRKDNQV